MVECRERRKREQRGRRGRRRRRCLGEQKVVFFFLLFFFSAFSAIIVKVFSHPDIESSFLSFQRHAKHLFNYLFTLSRGRKKHQQRFKKEGRSRQVKAVKERRRNSSLLLLLFKMKGSSNDRRIRRGFALDNQGKKEDSSEGKNEIE